MTLGYSTTGQFLLLALSSTPQATFMAPPGRLGPFQLSFA
jgi:hypothetical protein